MESHIKDLLMEREEKRIQKARASVDVSIDSGSSSEVDASEADESPDDLHKWLNKANVTKKQSFNPEEIRKLANQNDIPSEGRKVALPNLIKT